jgi:hypothetical protein
MGIESLCLNLRDTLIPKPPYSPSASANNKRPPPRLTAYQSSLSSSSSLEHTKPPIEVKVVCTLRVPRREIERLVALYPNELNLDSTTSDARTKFRKVHGVEVSLELSGPSPNNKE